MPSASLTTHPVRMVVGALAVVLLTVALATLSTLGSILAVFALIVPLGIMALCVFGAERVGFALLCVGFALAALSKGKIAAPIGASLTLSDMALFFGFILMMPRIARGRNRVSALYAGGMLIVVVVGFLASAANPGVSSSLKTLFGMIWAMVVIPMGIAALRPTNRMVRILAWSFIVGHMASVMDALATSPLSARAQGLTDAYNEYAESGLIVITLVLYLFHRTQRRWLIYLVTALSLVSIYTSGSRGALVSLAAVLVVVPWVERTAVSATLVTVAVAVGAVFIPLVGQSAGQQSALSRLFGNGTASTTDNLRSNGITEGFTRFLDHPLSGSGMSDLALIHSNLLEIAVGLGIFGLAGFCMVVVALLRPIFGNGEHRRLAYVAVAFVVFSATAPALTVRTMWVPLSLGFFYFRGFTEQVRESEEDSLAAEEHELVVHADHLPQLS